MAFSISDACVACGACESACPVGAISMGDGKFEILLVRAPKDILEVSIAVLAQDSARQVLLQKHKNR